MAAAAVSLLLLALIWSSSDGAWKQTIDFCFEDYGAVHRGTLQQDTANIYQIKKYLRSTAECATYCYADRMCRTAVYQPDGDCLFITNLTNVLTFADTGKYGDEILEMKRVPSSTSVTSSENESSCPEACVGPSVCLAECGSDGVEEAGCMVMETSQYDEGCQFEPYIQSIEYFLNNFDREHTGSATFFTVSFTKKLSWTTLRVKYRGTLRGGYSSGGGWGRWRILFDGSHCSNPGWIEGLNYNAESDTNHHKASGIHGICYDLAAKTWSISLTSEQHSTYFRAGWCTQNTRFYVDELSQRTWAGEPTVKPCPSLPVFNIREHITTGEWSNDNSATLWNFGYTKMEASTWLRINLDFMIRLHPQGQDSYSGCATWYIKIDGNNCQPQPLGKTLANLSYASRVNNEHRSVEVEGHCKGISAGYHTLSLYITTCPWGGSVRDIHTGWNGCRQRVLIEEFREGTNVVGGIAKDGTMYRYPQFNMKMHSAGHIANGNDNNIVWSIPNYNKFYVSSGLRIALSADGRDYYGHQNGNYDPCCRHYVRLNGNECNNPGTIEGIHYLNKWTNLHRPFLLEGTCYGINKGTVTVQIWAGICRHHGRVGECYFGWNSYSHIMVSETYNNLIMMNY